jgi:hypothetical protein
MKKLTEFGNVWLASCDFSGNEAHIRKVITYGIDAIVLKTAINKESAATLFTASRRKGNEMLNQSLGTDGNLFSTSPDFREETLSLEEAERIYRKIKETSDVKVVVSFGPTSSADFSLIHSITADAIEINPRFFQLDVPKPYILKVDSYGCSDCIIQHLFNSNQTPFQIKYSLREVSELNQIYSVELNRRFTAFKEWLAKLDLKIPLLFKLERQSEAMNLDDYLSLRVDGFTFSNSAKGFIYALTTDKTLVTVFGNGSYTGSILTQDTIIRIPEIRQKTDGKYLSASGGIISGFDAAECLRRGADSVQVCSALYLKGYSALEEIIRHVKGTDVTPYKY